MRKGIIAAIIVGSVLTVTGSVLFGIGLKNEKLDRAEVVHTYAITEAVNSISIDTKTADIEFKVSEDGESKVVCKEREKEFHSVSVKDGTLSIVYGEDLPWYERWFDFYLNKMNVSIYLPSATYDSLTLKGSTGDVIVNKEYSFKDVNVTMSTGDITFASNVTNNCKINTSTGSISVNEVTAKEMELKASTGSIKMDTVNVSGTLKLETSTGKVTLNKVLTNGDMNIHTSTGDITIVDSDATNVTLEASTGDVNATFLTSKIIYASTSTGSIDVPHLTTGGRCDIKTSTGDIKVRIK